jgi:hypothetical protein
MSFQIESGQMGAKAGRASAGRAASAFLAPPERKPVAGGPLARGIFFRFPPTKQPLALGATKRHLGATRFGRKDISYMKNSPTKARYNLGRTLLLAALAGMLLLIAAIAILGVLGSVTECQRSKEIIPLIASVIAPISAAALAHYFAKM